MRSRCTETFTLSSDYIHRNLLHREALTPREVFAQRSVHTPKQKILQSEVVHTETFFHTDGFTHGSFYTEQLLHRGDFTQKSFYTEELSHTGTFTHRNLYTETS